MPQTPPAKLGALVQMRLPVCGTVQLIALTLPVMHATSKWGHGVVASFIEAALNAPSGQEAIIMDVGANNGHWGDTVTERVRLAAPNVRVKLVFFEPQQMHQSSLQSIAARLGDTIVVSAAAWTTNTSLDFFLAERDSQASSTVEALARRFSGGSVRAGKRAVQRKVVPAVDFVDFLQHRVLAAPTRRPQPLVLLKVDIEAAEYKVLPRVLLSGLACGIGFWFVEWHMNALPLERRLDGMLLRHAMDGLLVGACSERHLVIEHDDAFVNNNGQVPGLSNLATAYQNRSVHAELLALRRSSRPQRATKRMKASPRKARASAVSRRARAADSARQS